MQDLAVMLAAVSVLYLVNETTYVLLGGQYRKCVLLTGCIGTPLHEMSHAVFARLFGMNVNKVVFYQPDPASKTLGYVDFTFNPHRAWHRIGLVIVGIAPLIGGLAVIQGVVSWADFPRLAVQDLTYNKTLFAEGAIPNYYMSIADYASSNWWTLLVSICTVSVVTHSTPSAADLRNFLGGIIVTLIASGILYAGGMALLGNSALSQIVRYGTANMSARFVEMAAIATVLPLCAIMVRMIQFGARLAIAKIKRTVSGQSVFNHDLQNYKERPPRG